LLALLRPLLGRGKDAPFVLGQLWLPGHYGLASQSLQQSTDAEQAIDRLSRYAGRLLPLLQPRPLIARDRLWLVFGDACGLPAAQRGPIVDLHLSAVSSYCNWRAGRRLPWVFHFSRTAPRDLATHAVMLGPELRFDCQVDGLSLPLPAAREPWPRDAAQRGAELAEAALLDGADPQALRRGWLAFTQELMLRQLIERNVGQDRLAQQLGISLATLKRQYAMHGTHWQAELDGLRTVLSVALLQLQRCTPAQVAELLGFVDPSNFRRSLRRWTGLSAAALAG
jgi:AraC-like DNA-binding protein